MVSPSLLRPASTGEGEDGSGAKVPVGLPGAYIFVMRTLPARRRSRLLRAGRGTERMSRDSVHAQNQKPRARRVKPVSREVPWASTFPDLDARYRNRHGVEIRRRTLDISRAFVWRSISE